VSDRSVTRGFVALSAAWFAGTTVAAVTDLAWYRASVHEDHLSEWLSAELLLLGAVVGLAALVRGARRGRPAPMAAVLAGGCLLGCCRELEFGRPFFGAKVWYSRNLFRPRAYLDPGYVRAFTRDEPLTGKPLPLYPVHLIFSGVLILCVALAAWYVIRHRRRLARELRRLAGRTYGRYLLLGLGGYVGAQALIGKVCEWILDFEGLTAWQARYDLDRSIVCEPLEAWSAACLLLAAVMFRRRPLRLRVPPAGAGGEG